MGIFQNVLCCTDFSVRAEIAFEKACEIARQNQAKLSLLHVVVPNTPLLPGQKHKPPKKTTTREILAILTDYVENHYLCKANGQKFEVFFRRGHPSVEIIDHIVKNEIDLVVLGSVGLKGVGLVVLGSTAEKVSRKAPCSCLMVR